MALWEWIAQRREDNCTALLISALLELRAKCSRSRRTPCCLCVGNAEAAEGGCLEVGSTEKISSSLTLKLLERVLEEFLTKDQRSLPFL